MQSLSDMAECLSAGELKVFLVLPLEQPFPTSGLQFLGCQAAPPKAHTQRGLGSFRVTLPYWLPEFQSGQETGTMVALLSWNNICISVTETQATRVLVTAEKTGFALKRNEGVTPRSSFYCISHLSSFSLLPCL